MMMPAKIYFGSLLLASFLLEAAYGGGSAAVKFGYSGVDGPEKWGSLSPIYAKCSNGKSQSPVNIVYKKTVANSNLKALIINYDVANVTLFNNGFCVGLELDSGSGEMVINDKSYTLTQMHWHSPSEHQINGVQYPLELHLVHQAVDGALSVVGILYKYGQENAFTAKMKHGLEELPKNDGHISLGLLDTKPLKENNGGYFRYNGSLTTPPCSENVIWNVLTKVATVSKMQVEELKAPLEKAYKQNNRPIQPLNGRRVSLYKQN